MGLLRIARVSRSDANVPRWPSRREGAWREGFTRLVVVVFSLGDDPIACINKAMAFLIDVAVSVKGRQGQSYSGTGYKSNATSSEGNNASGHARISKSWYKEKAMLGKAQEAGQILDEEQLAFLADPGVPDGQAVQTIIPNNAAF
ncbi:hypothetical protein Tco_0337453 [Tanacetum coccineum]